MLGIFLIADLFKVVQNIISVIPSVTTSLDPDWAQHFVGPYLSMHYLQRLLADDTSRQLVCKVYFDKKLSLLISDLKYYCSLYDS